MKVKIGPYKKDNVRRKAKVEFIGEDFYSLYYTLGLVILPALKEFKAKTPGYPGSLSSPEEWDEILDKMIYAFEHIINDSVDTTKTEYKKVQQGLNLFGKWYQALWY